MKINEGWCKWFAWRPVRAFKKDDNHKMPYLRWVWFKTIERKIEGFSHPTDGWISVSYRH